MTPSSPPSFVRTAGVVMQFSPIVRGTCAALLVAAVALVVFSMRSRLTEAGPVKLMLAIVLLLLTAATVEAFGVAHRLVPGGIERVSPWRTRLVVRWAEVVDLEWASRTRWYEVRGRTGAVVRVYQQLSGVPSFARAALDGVPPGVLDLHPGLRQQLEAATRGVEPPKEADREEWQGP